MYKGSCICWSKQCFIHKKKKKKKKKKNRKVLNIKNLIRILVYYYIDCYNNHEQDRPILFNYQKADDKFLVCKFSRNVKSELYHF